MNDALNIVYIVLSFVVLFVAVILVITLWKPKPKTKKRQSEGRVSSGNEGQVSSSSSSVKVGGVLVRKPTTSINNTRRRNLKKIHRGLRQRSRKHRTTLQRVLKASGKKYLDMIYPLLGQCDERRRGNDYDVFQRLQFFYQDLSTPEVKEFLGSRLPVKSNASRNYRPPELDELWAPVWFPPDSFVINGYDPKRFWKGNKYSTPEQFSGEFIEVQHVPDDDQDFYTVFGTWFYVTRGTGVWLQAGPKILTAQNKLFALRDLGLSTWEIANLFVNTQFMINDILPPPSLLQVAEQFNMKGSTPAEKIANLLEYYFKALQLLLDAPPDFELSEQEWEKLYLMDRMNNSADFDETINILARTQGYSSVQFVIQANDNGGWAQELVYVHQEMFLGTDENRMRTLLKKLWIANPLNLHQREQCLFKNDDKYGCLSCRQQPIVWCYCNSLKPTPSQS